MNRKILDQLTADLSTVATVSTVHPLDRPVPYPPKPEDIGRLTAEAVQKQYEEAAKAVEEMGKVVKERIQRLEQCLRECDNDLKVIAEMAQAIVEKGSHVAAEIEHTNSVAADIRAACNNFQQMIMGGKKP
jgi:DNA-directed RNA polymerase